MLENNQKKRKAIALFSGGLDSALAIKVVQKQNIEVIALNVNIGFGSRKDRRLELQKTAESLGAKFLEIDIRHQFVQDILFDPQYGYGKNMNPCIDCHANMFRVARNLMPELGADFLISGEVVGQRPMSQNKKALNSVLNLANMNKNSDEDILLRPLSALKLAPSLPERKGWIDREKLYGIYGRSRKIQFELVKEFKLENFESPAGGCLLTDPKFSDRLKEFKNNNSTNFITEEIDLIKFGRHFRLLNGAKLIIGRQADDNIELKKIAENPKIQERYFLISLVDLSGAFSIMSKDASNEEINIATKIILSYTKTEKNINYSVKFSDLNNKKEFLISEKRYSEIDERAKYLI
jgi:tRNA-specific 2-thiouridylase